jgi:hypothetical protein
MCEAALSRGAAHSQTEVAQAAVAAAAARCEMGGPVGRGVRARTAWKAGRAGRAGAAQEGRACPAAAGAAAADAAASLACQERPVAEWVSWETKAPGQVGLASPAAWKACRAFALTWAL